MIRILPLETKETMFCLYEDARLLAKCIYDPQTGEILRLEVLDPAALPLKTALIKAVLSSLEYAGIPLAWSSCRELFPILKALRFRLETSDRMSVSLKGYFDSACECGSCKG